MNPIEEVFTEIKGEDDYGLRRLELVFSVNGGDEQIVALYDGRGKKEMIAGYTFFLEDYELQPGDFISYYARAKDVGGPQVAMTDIYFIEARPFDRQYRQAQGGGGGGGGGGMEGTLSLRQREIVAATFKLIRDKDEYKKRGLGRKSHNDSAHAGPASGSSYQLAAPHGKSRHYGSGWRVRDHQRVFEKGHR